MTTKTTATMTDKFYEAFITVVPDCIRMDFLPAKFKGNINAFLSFENAVYNQANEMCSDYNGGSWEFVEAKDGNAFFIHPNNDDTSYTISNINSYKDYEVDGRIFGMLASWIIFSHASFAFQHKDPSASAMFANHYHALRNAFYSTVDKMVYEDPNVSAEEKKAIEEMSSIVFSYLD
ncbi:antirestriction protein [Psychrobacter sp. AOP31-A1-22]|uniref:antirestriction protein n=1 Tax=Psychrobacter sp. AOP31-A1-22 TaxID=3457696 RepID=UPI004034FEFB